jgi:hypothetical protein
MEIVASCARRYMHLRWQLQKAASVSTSSVSTRGLAAGFDCLHRHRPIRPPVDTYAAGTSTSAAATSDRATRRHPNAVDSADCMSVCLHAVCSTRCPEPRSCDHCLKASTRQIPFPSQPLNSSVCLSPAWTLRRIFSHITVLLYASKFCFCK